MGRRLAMIADGSHSTPWTAAYGSETAFRVVGLVLGDVVRVMVDLHSGETKLLTLVEGINPILDPPVREWKRYYVEKMAMGGRKHQTSVEVLLDSSGH